MCGIVGEFGFRGIAPRESTARVEALTAMMRRRGPDGGGVWTDERYCTMGFRRLAILDLTEAGDQPIVSRDGGHVLVFNGEVYNFRELRHELLLRGHTFRSSGDAEVVLIALMEWGVAALSRFNGMYALGFYDVAQRILLLARDHAGIKPLYVLEGSEGLAFASQYDQILAHPWSGSLAMSGESIGQYLSLGYIPAPRAALERTRMLEPGTWLKIDPSGRTSEGVHFRFPVNPEPTLRGARAMDAVDASVGAAVRRQLVSDVPVGAFLSGGIDSPLVVAHAREASGIRLPAYTIGLDGDPLDESVQAARYAGELDVEHHLEQTTPGTALALIDDVVEAVAEPFADPSIFSTLMVSRLASRDVRVLLSGDGGDELFWGYTGRFGSVLRRAPKFAQPYWLRTAKRAIRSATGIGRWEPHRAMRTIGHWYAAKHSHIPEGWLARLFPAPETHFRAAPIFEYTGHDLGGTANWLRWNEFVGHLTRVLLKVDRASMFHSVEVRVPLLDREVIEVATAVDWSTCLDLKTDTGKLPLRASLARRVTGQPGWKRGFNVPMDEWMRGPLRARFEERVLHRSDLGGLPFSRPAAKSMLEEHARGVDLGWGLWVLLSLALWEDTHLRSRAVDVQAERPLARVVA